MAERSHTHVYSRSALTVWRAVPLCCNAMLAQRMRAQRASHTAARAEYHTLACPRSSARPSNHHIWSDIGLATQTTKTVVRGARGTCLQTTCEGRFQCVLGTTHRDRHHATGVVALARVSSPSRRNYEITASSKCLLQHMYLIQHDDLVICAQHAPSTLARQARCSAVLALPFCRAASSTRCAIRASSLGFITWCREPQPPRGLGLGRGRQR